MILIKVTDCYHDVETVLGLEESNSGALELMKELEARSCAARSQVRRVTISLVVFVPFSSYFNRLSGLVWLVKRMRPSGR